MNKPPPVSFWVPGKPVQKGVHKAVCPRCKVRKGRVWLTGSKKPPYIVDDWKSELGARLLAWVRDVVTASRRVRPQRPWRGAVDVSVVYYFVQPKSNTDPYPSNSKDPDGDKLERAVWDALQVKGKAGGLIMVDDKQIVDWSGKKRWGPEYGAMVVAEAMEPEQLPLTDDAPLLPVKPRTVRKTRAPPEKKAKPEWF